MVEIRLKITRHAKEKMVLHGIASEQIKRVILFGAKNKQTDGYLASYTYIRVAYKAIGENYYKIKTVFVN